MRVTLGIMELQKPSEKKNKSIPRDFGRKECFNQNNATKHITENIISFFWVEMAPRYVFIMMCGYENMLIALLRAHNWTPAVWNKLKNSILINAISFPLNDRIYCLCGEMRRFITPLKYHCYLFILMSRVKNNSCEHLDARKDIIKAYRIM